MPKFIFIILEVSYDILGRKVNKKVENIIGPSYFTVKL